MKRPDPTFEISVHFWRDPKVIAAGFKAAVLWIRCGCESRALLADGVILEGQIPALATDLGDWKELAEKLVKEDMWKRCKGGYRIPLKRWARWNVTKAQVKEIRAFERERKRKQRSKSPGGCPGGTDDFVPMGHGGGPLSTSKSPSPCPSPTAPPPTSASSAAAAGGSTRTGTRPVPPHELTNEQAELATALHTRPFWIPEGGAWIDADRCASIAARPGMTLERVKAVLADAKGKRKNLNNPAGFVIAELERGDTTYRERMRKPR